MENQKNNDVKTLGQLFLMMCDDIDNITFIEAMEALLSLIDELSKKHNKGTKKNR